MLCKWCSGFCQKVSSLLLGFFVCCVMGFVFFFCFVFCFCAVFLLFSPHFFHASNTESFTPGT